MLITPYPPTPPLGGGRRRQLELLRWLANETDLTLATVVFGDDDEHALRALVPEGVHVITGRPVRGALSRKLPLALQWCWSARLARQIEEAHRAQPFERIVVSHSYGFVYAEGLEGAPRMIDAQNVESRLYLQFAALPPKRRAKVRRLAGRAGVGFIGASRTGAQISALEWQVWRQADLVACVSRQEQELIGAVTGLERTVLVPNCPSEAPDWTGDEADRRPAVSFAGSLDYIPNIEAVITLCDEVLPRLRSISPRVPVTVAGRRPSERLLAYCRERGVEVVPNPADMSRLLAGSVSACPIRLVCGTRLKIMDARQQRLPVVATSAAVEGLEVEGDPGLTVRDDLNEFAEAVAGLLEAPTSPPPPKMPGWQEVWEPLRAAVL